MSTIAPSARLGWRLLPGVCAAAVAVIAASVLIAALRDQDVRIAGAGGPTTVGAHVAEAAIWRTDAYPVGASGKLTKDESERFRWQKDRVRATVRDLADAIGVHPERIRRAARRLMTGAAASSLLKQAPRIPEGAEAVTVLKRGGHIGIQAPRFSAAAAQLHIVMQATIEEHLVEWRDEYRFWLQRADGKWQVISFDIDRAQR